MNYRLPWTVIVLLAFIAGSTFAVGIFLEARSLDYIRDHPYLVNLLSGTTGFAFSFMLVGVGFNWVATRHHHHRTLDEAIAALLDLDHQAEMLTIPAAGTSAWDLPPPAFILSKPGSVRVFRPVHMAEMTGTRRLLALVYSGGLDLMNSHHRSSELVRIDARSFMRAAEMLTVVTRCSDDLQVQTKMRAAQRKIEDGFEEPRPTLGDDLGKQLVQMDIYELVEKCSEFLIALLQVTAIKKVMNSKAFATEIQLRTKYRHEVEHEAELHQQRSAPNEAEKRKKV